MSPRILLLAPQPDFLLGPLCGRYECSIGWSADLLEGALKEHGQSFRGAVMAGGTVVQPELLARLPALEIIAVNGVGYDGVPLQLCRERGVKVTNTPDVLTEDVADVALALVLMTFRGLVNANRALHADRWAEGATTLTRALGGKRAGVVGLGRIGKAVARRLQACGMEVAYHGRTKQEVGLSWFASLRALAEWSDALIVCCPGGADTRQLVGADVLSALGERGILVNVSRGSVVDEQALILALERGTIAGAGLDVFENEPHVPEALKQRADVVLLPHVGSATRETRGAMAQLVLDNLAAHFSGRALLTEVNAG